VIDTGAGEANWEGVGCRLDRYMLELDVYMYESSFLYPYLDQTQISIKDKKCYDYATIPYIEFGFKAGA